MTTLKKTFATIFLFLLAFSLVTCEKKINNAEEKSCPEFSIIPQSPYSDPIWHPSGSIIGFNHTPIKSIDYNYGYNCPLQAKYSYKIEASGFWLINTDGTNQRRILSYELQNPAWSANGKWIAFVQDAQIFKMPFDGEKFDETKKEQLTHKGRNFFPTWSPDGEWIAFHQSICNATKSCGVWIYNLKTNSETFLYQYGGYPEWLNNNDIVFSIGSLNNSGFKIGDTVWRYNHVYHKKESIAFIPTKSSGTSRVKPFHDKIGFVFQDNVPQLYVMDTDGNNKKQLTSEGCVGFSWSPDGKIVYVDFDYQRIATDRGVLYTMNADGANKRQLTKNQL